MSADCQVLINGEECGVPAIGRCAVDGRAFCMTHQGRRQYTGSAYSDRCQPCEDKSDTAARNHELHYGQSYLMNTAAQELRAAGVPTVEIFRYRTEWVPKRFGRSQTIEHADLLATGWILGEFKWEHYVGDLKREDLLLTAFLDRSESRIGDRNCAAVAQDSQRGSYRIEFAMGTVRGWQAIATAVHHLAGTTESHRPYLVETYHPGIRRG